MDPGKLPRKPLELFRAHLLRRLKHIPNDRILLGKCGKIHASRKSHIGADEPPYGKAIMVRFRTGMGPERPLRIVGLAILRMP